MGRLVAHITRATDVRSYLGKVAEQKITRSGKMQTNLPKKSYIEQIIVINI